MKTKFTLSFYVPTHFIRMVFNLSLLILVLFSFGFIQQAQAQTVGIKSTGVLADDLGESIDGYKILYVELTPVDETGLGVIDGSFVLSQGEVLAWADYSICVRFLSVGRDPLIDLRNGGAFGVDESVAFEMDNTYQIWIETDFTSLTYSVYVQAPDMTEPLAIGTDYAYRNVDIAELAIWSCVFNPNNNNVNTVAAENMAYVDAVGKTGADGTGVSLLQNGNLKVYPNPASNYFTMDIKGEYSYELYNMSGSLVLNGNGSNSTSFGENINKGVYLLKVKQQYSENTLKVVKL